MKLFLLLACMIAHVYAGAQSKSLEREIKSGKIFTNGKLTYYYENDRNGNTVFSRNNGMNGEVTMVYVWERDSLNGITRNYSAHSNIGYSVSEEVREGNKSMHFGYSAEQETNHTFDRKTLNSIRSGKEFIKLPAIMELRSGTRQLERIELFNDSNNVIADYYLSVTGDTTSYHFYDYNEKGEMIKFHYNTPGSESWTWDIFYEYDDRGNQVKNYRLESENGIVDTSEVYNHIYNDSNKLISDNYYYKGEFRNKTDYFYNKNGLPSLELFYESEESEIDVRTVYKFRNGKYRKKIVTDYRSAYKGTKALKWKAKYW